MKKLLAFAVLILLTACAQTPQGKSIQQGHNADIASTAFALLANSHAVEANPMALPMLPVKLTMGYLFETGYCKQDADLARMSNTMMSGVVTNNILVGLSAGVVAAPVVGLAAGVGYWVYHDDLQPEVYDCNAPEDVQRLITQFADAYNREDYATIGALHHPQAVTPEAHTPPHIAWTYQELFTTSDPKMEVGEVLIHKGGYLATMKVTEGDMGGWREYEFTVEDGLIKTATY